MNTLWDYFRAHPSEAILTACLVVIYMIARLDLLPKRKGTHKQSHQSDEDREQAILNSLRKNHPTTGAQGGGRVPPKSSLP